MTGPAETSGRPARLGMITPSSNTCLEPMTYRMLEGRDDVSVHFSRVAVTRIALDASSDQQFGPSAMRAAAQLLAMALVDVVAWNGTSGSWLGLDHDRALVDQLAAATGVHATTSSLAVLDALQRFDLSRVALVTPYTADVNEQIAQVYAGMGVAVVGDLALGLTDNESFARVPPDDLLAGARRAVTDQPDAVVVLCTNLWGAPVVEVFERESGIPVLDSVATTLWRCLDLVGAAPLQPRWGGLLV